MTKKAIKICILGGGFGGLYTALYLSNFSGVKAGKYQITLVEIKAHFLFTPLLYELITGELQQWEIAPSYQKLLTNTSINFCQQKVKNIDLKNRQVDLENEDTLTYDYLVLAVGCENRYVNIPGLKTYGLTFRSLADVELLQGKLELLEATERQRIRVAVIGGGPNGVELACKLADRLGKRGEVRLIERGDTILKGFSQGVYRAANRAFKVRNIQLNLNTYIKEIQSDSITIIQENQAINYPIDLVLWAAGTQSRELIRQLDCQHNSQGYLLTLPTLQLVDYPEVFALGDIAEISNSNKWIPATAQSAYQQASFATKNIIAMVQGKRLKHFHYLHLGDMLTLGKGAAIVSSFFLNIEGRLAALIRRFVYVFRLPTLRHRLQVLKNFFRLK